MEGRLRKADVFDYSEKAGECLSMRIIKRNGDSYPFDVTRLVDAVSKAVILRETRKVEKEYQSVKLLIDEIGEDGNGEQCEHIRQIVEDILNEELLELEKIFRVSTDYYRLQLELERLENQRKQLQFLRRLKTARVSQMIRTAWMNRNYTAGRSNTGAVTDPMLLSIPTPPTSEAANRSLRCGGNMLAYI